jgi:peptidoglycan biosynthesis protein MviN/MurJ (putative lipid II flippase)
MTDNQDNKNKQEQQSDEPMTLSVKILIIFLILFVVTGIIAMVWSLVCLGKSGTDLQKFVGVLVAFFTGPFYFIYYGFNKGYCRDMSSMNIGGKRIRCKK